MGTPTFQRQVFQTEIGQVYTEDIEGVGSRRRLNDKTYIWVKYSGSTALAAGDMLCHDLSNGATLDQTVIIPATADLDYQAGVVQKNADQTIPDSSTTARYFWIQSWGVVTNLHVDGNAVNIAAGDYLTAKNADVAAVRDSTGAAPSYARTIIALEAATTDGANIAAELRLSP